MDPLSLTIPLFVLFLFSFFLVGTESALSSLKNKRVNKFVNQENTQSFLGLNSQSNSSLTLIASLLNASILAIYIIMLFERILFHFQTISHFIESIPQHSYTDPANNEARDDVQTQQNRMFLLAHKS